MARAGGSRGGGASRGGAGGGRSFGGRSGGGSPGGSFQRGGVQGRGSAPGGLGGLGSSPRRRPPTGGVGGIGGLGGYGGYGGGWGPGYNNYGPYPPPPPPRRRRGYGYGYGNGCLVLPVILVVVLMVALLSTTVMASTGTGSGSITKSTIQREALPAGSVVETDYYTDELGWISNPTLLLPGMQHFYAKTGVQPYLYITDNIDGSTTPSNASAEAFATRLYDELFQDEGHFLLIFMETGNQYHTWYLAGSEAVRVIDLEASNILLDYIDKYYTTQNLSDEEYFSKSFNDAADRIMTVTRSPWLVIGIVLAVVAVLILLLVLWRNARRRRMLEDMRTEQILRTPLETFGDKRVEELENKYSMDNDGP